MSCSHFTWSLLFERSNTSISFVLGLVTFLGSWLSFYPTERFRRVRWLFFFMGMLLALLCFFYSLYSLCSNPPPLPPSFSVRMEVKKRSPSSFDVEVHVEAQNGCKKGCALLLFRKDPARLWLFHTGDEKHFPTIEKRLVTDGKSDHSFGDVPLLEARQPLLTLVAAVVNDDKLTTRLSRLSVNKPEEICAGFSPCFLEESEFPLQVDRPLPPIVTPPPPPPPPPPKWRCKKGKRCRKAQSPVQQPSPPEVRVEPAPDPPPPEEPAVKSPALRALQEIHEQDRKLTQDPGNLEAALLVVGKMNAALDRRDPVTACEYINVWNRYLRNNCNLLHLQVVQVLKNSVADLHWMCPKSKRLDEKTLKAVLGCARER